MAFNVDIQGALKGLAESEIKMRAAVGLYADSAGKKLEAEAKQNAPWQDNSGDARRTITGGHEWQGDKCFTYVFGNMKYSPYLELCSEGNYAALYPAVKKLAPEILRGLSNLLK